jgi:phosphate transport system permease protein
MAVTPHAAMPSSRRRHITNMVFSRIGPMLALLLIVVPVVWVIVDIIARAVPHWQWSVLTTNTVGASGGLQNAILGTLILMAGVLVIAGTLGVLGGVFLAELAGINRKGNQRGGVLRSATEILSGVPSIALGLVGYLALVVGFHWGFSLMAALVVLSVMVIPYIARGTETAVRQVPTAYREGAEALGMPPGYGLRKVVLKSALPGIVTSLLIALAISAGETAPLLYTAGWYTGTPKAQLFHQPIGYLTYPVWTFWDYPSNEAHYLAFDAALILLVIVLVLLVVSRVIVNRTQRHAEGASTATGGAIRRWLRSGRDNEPVLPGAEALPSRP